jgi:hypothetical protein
MTTTFEVIFSYQGKKDTHIIHAKSLAHAHGEANKLAIELNLPNHMQSISKGIENWV